MSALSDTLAAAQSRALAALERAYLRDLLDPESFAAKCDAIGARDVIERAELLNCLDVLREYGATEAPRTNGHTAVKMMSPGQRDLIARMCRERDLDPPDMTGATFEQASDCITAIKNGAYSRGEWDIPF